MGAGGIEHPDPWTVKAELAAGAGAWFPASSWAEFAAIEIFAAMFRRPGAVQPETVTVLVLLPATMTLIEQLVRAWAPPLRIVISSFFREMFEAPE